MGAESGVKSRLAVKLTGTAVVIITVLIVIGVLQYRSVRALVEVTHWVDHTDVVTSVLNSSRSNLHAESIAVQAFMLSSQDSPLSRKESASANLTRDLETLHELTSDNPRQQSRLAHIDSMLTSQRKLETELIAMRRRGRAKTESFFQPLNDHDQIDEAVDAETLRAFARNNITTEVVVARNGAEALDFLFAQGGYAGRDLSLMPEVILLDLKLPKVSGLEVLRALRASDHTRLLPVVVLTSSLEEQDLIRSYSLGANSYVRKPIDFNQFTEAVRHLSLYWLVLNEKPPLMKSL